MRLVMGTSKMSHRREFDPNALRARDILVIVPVIVALGALIIFFGLSVTHDVYIRWGGLALATVVLFGLFLISGGTSFSESGSSGC